MTDGTFLLPVSHLHAEAWLPGALLAFAQGVPRINHAGRSERHASKVQ